MPQHISLRVPWHDHGWDGTVCADPQNNNACLRLRNISESRDDKVEAAICGQCMVDHADKLSCIGEGACFMSSQDVVRITEHVKNPRTSRGNSYAASPVYCLMLILNFIMIL